MCRAQKQGMENIDNSQGQFATFTFKLFYLCNYKE